MATKLLSQNHGKRSSNASRRNGAEKAIARALLAGGKIFKGKDGAIYVRDVRTGRPLRII